MSFDFDHVIDRRGSDSLKWHSPGQSELLPMWVADMDFASPDCVLRAVRQRVDHAVFGYSVATDEVNRAVVDWAASHYQWEVDPEWIIWLPGLVPGLHAACLAYATGAEEVLTFVPVYPPFLSAPHATGRAVKQVPLTRDKGHWTIDLDAMKAAVGPSTRLLLFCHPHNPVGRAFRREELEALAEVCDHHDLIVCSDEIHCDLMLDARPHIPFACLGESIGRRTVTLMSAAKTFNITGLNCGFAIISEPQLRQRFRRAARGIVPSPNALGYAACRAAFQQGEAWRRALLDYLRGNRDLIESYLPSHLPMFSMDHVEATYLAWIDTRWLGERNKASFFEQAGVRLSDGATFAGAGFMRLNFGCPRTTLRQALERIREAVTRLDGQSGS
jgi:cystathionine beta-lyase